MPSTWKYLVKTEQEMFRYAGIGHEPLQTGLDLLGAEGWELVLARPEPPGDKQQGGYWVFKRPKD